MQILEEHDKIRILIQQHIQETVSRVINLLKALGFVDEILDISNDLQCKSP